LGVDPTQDMVPAPSTPAKGRYQVLRISVPTTQTSSSNNSYLPIFREFNMVWSPSVDWSIVDELQPDILIGQSIERFLASVPNS
ncbi:hypothetical protein PY310_19380, partial [Pseudarthrobacter sp. H3Y2-7]|uniref:hypothetical protein n=1 Tax=Pseudarthrobacter naphthalenicus TaxID=3031328 RepID=UPI0023AF50DF